MHLLSGEVWKPGCCPCHDYGKGGDRRGEDGKGEVCKKMLIILPFLYNRGGCIIRKTIILDKKDIGLKYAGIRQLYKING